MVSSSSLSSSPNVLSGLSVDLVGSGTPRIKQDVHRALSVIQSPTVPWHAGFAQGLGTALLRTRVYLRLLRFSQSEVRQGGDNLSVLGE